MLLMKPPFTLANRLGIAFALICILMLSSFVSDKPAYQLFRKGGKSAQYTDLLKEAAKADVVLFGELHNNPVAHWLQLELAKDLHKQKADKLVLAGEMFEADNQVIIDEYLQDRIAEKSFESEARLWPNYRTDYKPLLQFAKANKLRFVASNVPRRYASVVSKQGQEALQNMAPEAKAWLPALPFAVDYELPGYKAMLGMFGSGHGSEATGKLMIQAQALKDATMAASIAKAAQNGNQVLHFNGAYHSDNYEGIVWYLKQQAPNLKVLTISTAEQPDLQKLDTDNSAKADFILVVPESMTKTH